MASAIRIVRLSARKQAAPRSALGLPISVRFWRLADGLGLMVFHDLEGVGRSRPTLSRRRPEDSPSTVLRLQVEPIACLPTGGTWANVGHQLMPRADVLRLSFISSRHGDPDSVLADRLNLGSHQDWFEIRRTPDFGAESVRASPELNDGAAGPSQGRRPSGQRTWTFTRGVGCISRDRQFAKGRPWRPSMRRLLQISPGGGPPTYSSWIVPLGLLCVPLAYLAFWLFLRRYTRKGPPNR